MKYRSEIYIRGSKLLTGEAFHLQSSSQGNSLFICTHNVVSISNRKLKLKLKSLRIQRPRYYTYRSLNLPLHLSGCNSQDTSSIDIAAQKSMMRRYVHKEREGHQVNATGRRISYAKSTINPSHVKKIVLIPHIRSSRFVLDPVLGTGLRSKEMLWRCRDADWGAESNLNSHP